MTPNDFRQLALSLPEVIESAHMRHPDFRVGGRIFATLGYPDEDSAVVKLTREVQKEFVRNNAGVFQTGERRLGPARQYKHLSTGCESRDRTQSTHCRVAQHGTETAIEECLAQTDCFAGAVHEAVSDFADALGGENLR